MLEWIKGTPESPEERAVMAQIQELYVKGRHTSAIYEIKKGGGTVWRTELDGRLVQRKTRGALVSYLYDYYQAKENPPMTLGGAIESYISYKEAVFGIDGATAARNRYTARFFDGLKDENIENLTTSGLRIYIRSKTFKEYEIKAAVQLLKGALKWSVGIGKLTEDPSYPIEPREFFGVADRTKKTAQEKVFLPLDIERIKAKMRAELPNMRAFGVLLSIATGMRAGEIVTVKWSDIQDGCIWIHTQQRLVLDENGHRVGFEELPYTKDERVHPHGGRLYPLNDEIRALLSELEAYTGGGTYLLEEDGRWITKTSYEKYLKRHMRALGYSVTNNHAFRMSLNSNVLIPAGLTPAERAYILGHSIETNERYYTHTRKEEAAEIGAKLDAARGHVAVMSKLNVM